MKKAGNLLIVDDNEDILFTLNFFLKQHLKQVITETDPQKIPDLMTLYDFDMILLDMNFNNDMSTGQEGFLWLQKILDIDKNAVVIFLTAYGDIERAVKSMKMGAADFILKPWDNDKLLEILRSAIILRNKKREMKSNSTIDQQISSYSQPYKDFIGESPAMKEVFSTIYKVAKTDASVLILGENGTGKELVAKSLHYQSNRKDKTFISVDLGAVAETLFESELFGHKKGSFTDAHKDRVGRFESATGGSIFLDEIGNLPLHLQAKLLTVLEKRELIPVGGNISLAIDIRLICATNMPVYDLVEQKKFRQDLLYRINTVEIHLPPLRNRIEDINILSNHFLKLFTEKYKKGVFEISLNALKKLEAYSWPGNVRELRHAIERAVILCDGHYLQDSDFWFSKQEQQKDLLEFDSFNIDNVEKSVIQKVLFKHKGNITHAAKELGLTRASLYRRLEKYEI